MLPIAIESYEEAMCDILTPEDLEANVAAFRKGSEAVRSG
jgi:hypothetical protein